MTVQNIGVGTLHFEPISLADLCKSVPQMPREQLCLTLPGGAEFCPNPTVYSTGMLEYAQLALGHANSALAPLRPVFELIEAIQLIVKCLETIPDVIGPPPNPQPLIEVLGKLAQKMQLIVKLAPPFTIPIILVQVLDMILVNMQGVVDELMAIARQLQSIEFAKNANVDVGEFRNILNCVSDATNAQMSNLQKMMASINPVIEMLNTFAQMAGIGDPFPLRPYESRMDRPIVEMAEEAQEFVNTLRAIRRQIPI